MYFWQPEVSRQLSLNNYKPLTKTQNLRLMNKNNVERSQMQIIDIKHDTSKTPVNCTFYFKDGSQTRICDNNIECSCACITKCDHLNFLFNKVLKLKELGKSIYDYGDMDTQSWHSIEKQLYRLFQNLSTTTCSICFCDLHGINNISRCNHMHKECAKHTKKCYRCEYSA